MTTTLADPHALARQMLHDHPQAARLVMEYLRFEVSQKVVRHHKGTVAYGPFKGLRLNPRTHWSGPDQGTMVLGLYEHQILDELVRMGKTWATLIDVGAGDGYYGIGCLIAQFCKKSYCFELNPRGQEILKEVAALNGVRDRVTVFGAADRNFLDAVPAPDRDNALVIMDIEGGEYDVVTPEMFAVLKTSTIIIEIHRTQPDWRDRARAFARMAALSHKVKAISFGPRDLSQFPELHDLPDSERWLLCSERRAYFMNWLVFEPA